MIQTDPDSFHHRAQPAPEPYQPLHLAGSGAGKGEPRDVWYKHLKVKSITLHFSLAEASHMALNGPEKCSPWLGASFSATTELELENRAF